MVKGKWKIALLFLILFLILSACGNKVEEPAQEASNQVEEELVTEEPDETDTFRYAFPLTGEKSEVEPNDRAIAVMVNNHPAARQQSGLHKADIVLEILAEGGVTRFLAIFQSENPEVVGPVRSARDYYIELAKGYDSLYVFHGWSPEAMQMITSGYIDSLNGLYYDGTLFERASFRNAPHNSYITFDNIMKGAEDNGYDMTGAPIAYLFLNDDEEVQGEAHNTITIDYSTADFKVQYKYDEEESAYSRFSGDEQTVDYDTNEPILVNNIFIPEMKHSVIDNEGRREIDITSGGDALLFHKGKMQKIEWKNINGRIVPFSDGEEVPLTPGKTWINIVPDLNIVSY